MTALQKFINRNIQVVRIEAFQITGDLEAMRELIHALPINEGKEAQRYRLLHDGDDMILMHEYIGEKSSDFRRVTAGDWIVSNERGFVGVYSDKDFQERFTAGPITIAA